VDFDPREFLKQLFREATAFASAERCVPPNLPPPPKGRTIVVGAGKASAAMAKSVEDHWRGELSGIVVTRYGHGAPCRRIEVIEAAHPIPDATGVQAAERMLSRVRGLSPDDLVLALISGGGSALLALPAPGVTLEDTRAVTAALLKSGAPIAEMNCVRKHLSAISGGRLALAAHPARVASLIISDVPGDDPALVASGPTSPDSTTSADALGIIGKYQIEAPPAVRQWLANPGAETPKPGNAAFDRVTNQIIMSSRSVLAHCTDLARHAGFEIANLGDLEGEAREVARRHAEVALQLRDENRGCVILSGGETTVTVRGGGRGGRNTEYLLALCDALSGADGIWAIACDTDGIDGTEDNAGAIIAPDTLQRGRALGFNTAEYLARNDSYNFFSALGDLVITGPTRTNVNDFRAILVASGAATAA
jgi:hydroxypyruvate reductase